MKKRIVYIYSKLSLRDAFAVELCKSNFSEKYEIIFISLNDKKNSLFETSLREVGVPVHFIYYNNKKSDFFPALWKTFLLLRQLKPDVVHTHLLDANLVGLLAALLAGVKKRVYTRHHSTQNHTYHPHAVYYDRAANFLATDIIAISENVRSVLLDMEGADPKKIHLVNHGFDFKKFSSPDLEKVAALRKKYGAEGKYPVIGLFSRYIRLKGVQYVLPAFREILARHPNAYLICSNAFPTKLRETELAPLFASLPKSSYCEIESEDDIASFYSVFDVFIHVPIDRESEGFGMVYVEALMAGIPSVFTLSGIAPEFIEDGKNALVVDFQNSEQITQAVEKILADKKLVEHLKDEGQKIAAERFPFEKVPMKLSEVYQ
jgi:glycosyltransferase involved in cell wall biosynthesis